MTPVITDTLIDRCHAGDSTAQMELYSLLFRSVYSSALRITHDTQSAEEITQDSFLKVFKDINKYRDRLHFAIRRIAINGSIDLLRRRRVSFVEFSSQSDVAEQEEPYDEEPVAQSVDDIKRAIEELPTGYRLAITLRLIEELSFEDIASELGITASTARSQFIRAKQKLIEILRK